MDHCQPSRKASAPTAVSLILLISLLALLLGCYPIREQTPERIIGNAYNTLDALPTFRVTITSTMPLIQAPLATTASSTMTHITIVEVVRNTSSDRSFRVYADHQEYYVFFENGASRPYFCRPFRVQCWQTHQTPDGL